MESECEAGCDGDPAYSHSENCPSRAITDRKLVEHKMDRAKELLREMSPAIRDILWCALVWNDHNFTYEDLLNHARAAAKSLGIKRGDGADWVNSWMEDVDEATRD